MTFETLQRGDVFYIDGAPYQAYRVHGRIVGCLYLDANMQHVLAHDDSSGFGLKTTVFSDLRVNANNASAAECAKYLQTLIDLNNTAYELLQDDQRGNLSALMPRGFQRGTRARS